MCHSQSPGDQCPQESRDFLMEYTYSDSSPWTNVSLAVIQRSGIAKLASPRKDRTQSRNWGLSKENITACPARSGSKGNSSKQMSTGRGYSKVQTLLSPAADPLVRRAIAFPIAPGVQDGNARSRDADVKAAWPCATQHGECGEGVGGTRAADGRGRTRISGCWVDAGGHDRGVRRWGVGSMMQKA